MANSAGLPHLVGLSSPGRCAIPNKSFGQMLLTCNLSSAIQPSTSTDNISVACHISAPVRLGVLSPTCRGRTLSVLFRTHGCFRRE